MSARPAGPFLRQVFIPDKHIERRALEELQNTGLLPDKPGPVPVEKFCSLKWGQAEQPLTFGDDVLGITAFNYKGFDRIYINTTLTEDKSDLGVIRYRSTLAHEIGHGVLHEELHIEKLQHDLQQAEMFGQMERRATSRMMTRENHVFGRPQKYEWWEIQANRFMAAMLMPRPLLEQVLQPRLGGGFDDTRATIKDRLFKWQGSIQAVEQTFKVSNQMAIIAVDGYIKKVNKQIQEGRLL